LKTKKHRKTETGVNLQQDRNNFQLKMAKVRLWVVQLEAGADLGFYKGGCPIHLKWAPEVEP